MVDSKNKVVPVPSYLLKDGVKKLFIVNKTGEQIAVFFNQTDETATLEIRKNK